MDIQYFIDCLVNKVSVKKKLMKYIHYSILKIVYWCQNITLSQYFHFYLFYEILYN